MPREEMKSMIRDFVKKHGPALTARQIARGVGRSKSPHFVGILSEMCEDNELVCQWAGTNNGLFARYFSLPESVLCLGI